MAVLEIKYLCRKCNKESSVDNQTMICEFCGGILRGIGGPGICGTKDNFGFKNQFVDDNNGKVIDNWKTWEKSGFRNPVEMTKNNDVKEKIKCKIDKIKKGYTNANAQ